MSDAGHTQGAPLSSSPSSETLSVEEQTLEDLDASSTVSSSTTICWIPGGLSGKVLQALGPSVVDLVTYFAIKKRLSSISSEIDVRLHAGHALSKDETELLRPAYRDLMELSSGSYKEKITTQARVLRLAILRALIKSEHSCLDTYWHTHTLRKMWAELDDLASGPYETHIRDMACDLRAALVTKVTEELSSLRTRVRTQDLGAVLDGTNIVSILCHDLAYGIGGYDVQSALDRISCSSWGVIQIKKLDRRGDIVQDCVRRMLVDFDNVYSRGMAFRIFGDVAAANNTGKLAELLSGPLGVGSLIDSFSCLVQSTVQLYHNRYGVQCVRFVEASCTALLSACCHGFLEQAVQQGLCSLLIELVEDFAKRDKLMHQYIEDDEYEDPDVERDHIAACKLMLKLLESEEAKHFMRDARATKTLKAFGTHSNRQFSEWHLKFLIGAIWRKLG